MIHNTHGNVVKRGRDIHNPRRSFLISDGDGQWTLSDKVSSSRLSPVAPRKRGLDHKEGRDVMRMTLIPQRHDVGSCVKDMVSACWLHVDKTAHLDGIRSWKCTGATKGHGQRAELNTIHS